MPESKRNKVLTLSKTKKKGREHKELTVNSLRQALDEYTSVYVFTFENMRNVKFKEFTERLKPTSRFFLGSNKVMQIALGRTAVDEVKEGIHEVSKFLQGKNGLFSTNLPKNKVQSLFEAYEEHDFVRTGFVANETEREREGLGKTQG
ncbi:hypothetical protein AMTRI_Chr03g51290 [Amborella trichopoda]